MIKIISKLFPFNIERMDLNIEITEITMAEILAQFLPLHKPLATKKANTLLTKDIILKITTKIYPNFPITAIHQPIYLTKEHQ